jgi:hypothetical protein
MELPNCLVCHRKGETSKLIPLSDYGQDGATVQYKAWICSNPDCTFAVRIDKGTISRRLNVESKHS